MLRAAVTDAAPATTGGRRIELLPFCCRTPLQAEAVANCQAISSDIVPYSAGLSRRALSRGMREISGQSDLVVIVVMWTPRRHAQGPRARWRASWRARLNILKKGT